MDPLEVAHKSLFHRGAEADLYLARIGPWEAVLKQRVPKQYRQKGLDDRIRRERTVREATIISEARRAGVSTPTILSVSPDECLLCITFVQGTLARDSLDDMSPQLCSRLFQNIGRQVGYLHGQGIVHGDLTTSNMIISGKEQPFLIDFGLSDHSNEVEDRAVDLHLLRRSIATTHKLESAGYSRALMKGYAVAMGEHQATAVNLKTQEIARRGRYFAVR